MDIRLAYKCSFALLLMPILLLIGCYRQIQPGEGPPVIDSPSLKAKWVLRGGLSSWYQGVDTVAIADGRVYFIGSLLNDAKENNNKKKVDEEEDVGRKAVKLMWIIFIPSKQRLGRRCGSSASPDTQEPSPQ